MRAKFMTNRLALSLGVGVLIMGFGALIALRIQTFNHGSAAALAGGERGMRIYTQMVPFKPEMINYPSVEVVALGTVTEALPSRWVTADGLLPIELRGREESSFGANIDLATPVKLQVKEYWKTPQAVSVLLVRSLGGRIGDFRVTYDTSDAPKDSWGGCCGASSCS
jgi:hypothetical protein